MLLGVVRCDDCSVKISDVWRQALLPPPILTPGHPSLGSGGDMRKMGVVKGDVAREDTALWAELREQWRHPLEEPDLGFRESHCFELDAYSRICTMFLEAKIDIRPTLRGPAIKLHLEVVVEDPQDRVPRDQLSHGRPDSSIAAELRH